LFWAESEWDKDAKPDLGIAQISEKTVKKYYPNWSVARLKNDCQYNLEAGAKIFEDKYKWVKKHRKEFRIKYHLGNMSDLDMTILAYNSMRHNRCYLYRVKKFQKEKPWLERMGWK
jgi:hypothetical protein